MCVKLPPKDLNLGLSPPHPTSIYTCEIVVNNELNSVRSS